MAQTVVKDVKSKGAVLGQTSITLFDTLDEAEEEIGEKDILMYVNRCITIDALDSKRRELTGGSGGTGIRDIMKKVKDNPDLLAQIKALIGEV